MTKNINCEAINITKLVNNWHLIIEIYDDVISHWDLTAVVLSNY